METKLLNESQIKEAASILKEGGILAFPTETVYGLGVIASNKSSFDNLVKVKQRSPEKPFTLMCCNITQAVRYCEVNVGSIAVMKHFFPGSLTVLLKARDNVPEWINLGKPTIGVRIPNNEFALALIEAVDEPLLVPSANKSDEPAQADSAGVFEIFKGEIDGVIEGKSEGGIPSTIVDLSVPGEIKIIREGPVSLEEIEEVYQNAWMSIAIGCDHGGFALKNEIATHLSNRGFELNDYGTFDTSSCDYPVFAHEVAHAVAEKDAQFGILVCTSGEGIMMAANKVKGIRAGIGYDDVVTGKMREHNDANIVCFGAKYMKKEDVLRRVDIFLSEQASTLTKHVRRVKMIEE